MSQLHEGWHDMSLKQINPIVQDAVDNAISEGKQRSFEQFTRVYPNCIGIWDNAERFHASQPFRELGYSPTSP